MEIKTRVQWTQNLIINYYMWWNQKDFKQFLELMTLRSSCCSLGYIYEHYLYKRWYDSISWWLGMSLICYQLAIPSSTSKILPIILFSILFYFYFWLQVLTSMQWNMHGVEACFVVTISVLIWICWKVC